MPSSFTILANDELTPSGTFYLTTVFDSNGARVFGPERWVFSGASPIDLDTLTPTIIDPAFADPILSNPQAAQAINDFNLTLPLFNNVRIVDGVKFTTIQEAIDDLPATGGIVIDPREGDKTLSSTITFNKPVQLYVSYGRYTSSASPILDFPVAGGDSAVIGPGPVDEADGGNGASFRGNTSAITPLIRIEGTDTSTRTQRITLKNIGLKGEGNTSSQLGLLANFATDITLNRVYFFDLGQAQDIDDVFGIHMSRMVYHDCGSGNTAATATVRVENRSGGLLTEQVRWSNNSLWEAVATDIGMGLYVGNTVTQVRVTDSKFDYGTNTTATSLITFFRSSNCYVSHSDINGADASSLVAAIDITGNGTEDSKTIKVSDSHIAFGGAIGVRFDFTRASQVSGGTFVGDGNGTAVSATSNATGCHALGYKVDSNDTPWSDSGTGNGALYLEANSPFDWQLRSAGLTLGNADWLRGRNAADSADIDVIRVSGTDFIVMGDTGTPMILIDAINPLEGNLTNIPRWIFKQVDHTDMTAAATADTFTLWTLPANTMIHDIVGTVVTAWEAAVGLSAAVASVGTQAGAANDLTLDDDFFSAATVYELHDATASGGKGALLFDSTDKFAPYMFVAGGVIELQMDLTGDDHADTNAGQARIYALVSQPLGNTTTEAN
jgi:hypothetical protein